MDELQRILVVALGSALGGVARYGVGRLVPQQPDAFPWGTFSINALGSLVIGAVLGLALALERAGGALDTRWRLFLATGICGGFTTFSALSWEARALLESRAVGLAAAYVLGSVAVGIGAVYAGAEVGRRLGG